MQNRIYSFDWIRAISVIGILLCHSCFKWNGYDGTGRYLAQMFNLIFLIISAFLIGLKWEKVGYQELKSGFLTNRIKRLSISYYPYLILLFLYLYISKEIVKTHQVIAYIAFLPWFDKINGFGHLWYITMIMICYALCFVFSRSVICKQLICSKIGGG